MSSNDATGIRKVLEAFNHEIFFFLALSILEFSPVSSTVNDSCIHCPQGCIFCQNITSCVVYFYVKIAIS